MGQISDIKREALDILRADPRFINFHLTGEFAGTPRELPVRKPTMAVGVDSVETEPGGLGGYLGDGAGLSHTGSVAVVTLRFDCYIPQSSDIAGAHGLFEAICEVMTDSFGAFKVWCDPAKPDKQALSTNMTARASIKACLGKSEDAPLISGVIVQRRSETFG